MTEQDLIKFKNLSMQDGRLNLQWFADYVAQAEREGCADLVFSMVKEAQEKNNKPSWVYLHEAQAAIRARG